MSTAIFVDTYRRDLWVHSVSVTEISGIPEKGLVLRFGGAVGRLQEITRHVSSLEPKVPILVPTRGYSAHESGGFVTVLGQGYSPFKYIIGMQGMPWRRHKGLFLCSDPIEVLVLRPGTAIRPLNTHVGRMVGDDWHSHSNPATADAARKAIELRRRAIPFAVFITEGQSDYARAWELSAESEAYRESFSLNWPREHREERFSDEAMLLAAVRGIARREETDVCLDKTSIRLTGKIFLSLNMLSVDSKLIELPTCIRGRFMGRIQELAKTLAAKMEEEGWKASTLTANDRYFLEANTPEGEVVIRKEVDPELLEKLK